MQSKQHSQYAGFRSAKAAEDELVRRVSGLHVGRVFHPVLCPGQGSQVDSPHGAAGAQVEHSGGGRLAHRGLQGQKPFRASRTSRIPRPPGAPKI